MFADICTQLLVGVIIIIIVIITTTTTTITTTATSDSISNYVLENLHLT